MAQIFPRAFRMRQRILALFLALPAGLFSVPALAEVVSSSGGDWSAPSKRFVEVDGNWGEVEIGQIDGVRQRLVVTGPSESAAPLGDNAAKFAYYAPQFRGFELGMSYAPMPRGAEETPDPREALHMLEAAASKKMRVGKAQAKLTAGTSRARVRAQSHRVPKQSWIVGAQVAWDAVRMEGDVRERFDADGAAFRSWNTGITYRTGSWNFKMQMQRTQEDNAPVVKAFTADAFYDVTPRLRITADIDRAASDGNVSTVVLVGAKVVF